MKNIINTIQIVCGLFLLTETVSIASDRDHWIDDEVDVVDLQCQGIHNDNWIMKVEKVKKFGEYSFVRTNFCKIKVADSVSTIRHHAFLNAKMDAFKANKIMEVKDWAFENALINLFEVNYLNEVDDHAFARANIKNLVIDELNDFGKYVFENATFDSIKIRKITNPYEKVFYRADSNFHNKLFYGITAKSVYIDELEYMYNTMFKKANINELKIRNITRVCPYVFAHTNVGKLDILHLQDMNEMFRCMNSVEHVGLPDTLGVVMDTCFTGCNGHTIKDMSVYCENPSCNNVMNFNKKLYDGGLNSTCKADNLKTLSIVLPSPSEISSEELAKSVKTLNTVTYINEILENNSFNPLSKTDCFANIDNLNIYVENTPVVVDETAPKARMVTRVTTFADEVVKDLAETGWNISIHMKDSADQDFSNLSKVTSSYTYNPDFKQWAEEVE